MPLRLASVGSSFAAGPGIEPVADKFAGRSAVNYGALLAEHISATTFTDLTVSGATLLNITQDPQVAVALPPPKNGPPATHTFPPQITQLPSDADVVLILGGGNDINYIGNFFVDAARKLPYLREAMGLPAGSKPEDVPDLPPPEDEHFRVDPTRALALRYAKVLEAVHAKASGAHVLVVEYLAMLGPHTKPEVDVPFSAEQVARHQERAQILENATRLALSIDTSGEERSQVDRSGWCSLVSVADLSRAEHAIGSSEPWVSSVTPELVKGVGVFHPNAQGMVGVEKLVYDQLVKLGKI